MMRLMRVELARLRWRRAIVVMLVGAVAIPLVLLLGYAWSTRPISAADIAQAKQQAATEAAQPYVIDQVKQCEDDPEKFVGPGGVAADCAQLTPNYKNYLYRQTFELPVVRANVAMAAITVLSGLMMLIGTTFVGHDWNTGSMSNQLLFEPRRLRVWLAKALAVMITGALVGGGVLALFWGGATLIASGRDIKAPAGFWGDLVASQARGVLAIALAGLLGLALTMLFRSTVATLSLMFGVALAGSLFILAVLGESASRWLLPTNFFAFVLGGFDYYDQSACSFSGVSTEVSQDCTRHLSMLDGGVYLGVVLLVAVGLSLWSMQRRDVP